MRILAKHLKQINDLQVRGQKINYTAVPNKLTASNGNVYYFDKDYANNHLSITAKKIEKGSDVYKAGNVIKAYYFTKKNPGDVCGGSCFLYGFRYWETGTSGR